MKKQWDNYNTRLDYSNKFIDQVIAELPRSGYEELIYLLHIIQSIKPTSFREKLKFVFRHHQNLLDELNPLLPDEYQFNGEYLPYEVSRYEALDIYRPCIEFFNEFKKKVPLETLRSFHELIKSHKRKEIDGAEIFGKVYDLLRGDFDLMKQVSEVLGNPMTDGCSSTPSYVPMPKQTKACSSDDDVLNTSLRVYEAPAWGRQKNTSEYLYSVDELINACLQPCHSKGKSVSCQDRRFELHNLKYKLTVAEDTLNKVLKKLERGKLHEGSGLRKYWNSEKVIPRLRVVERMFGNMDNLMSAPLDKIPVCLEKLSRNKERLGRALEQYDSKHKH